MGSTFLCPARWSEVAGVNELLSLSALELSRALKRGELSAVEAVEASARAISAREEQVNAFITTTVERAAEQAKTYNGAAGLLAGVPYALKDNICTRGIATTCASSMLETFVPPYDAHVAQRLEQAGGILMGKTNMDEFAMGSTSETSCFGPVGNPWDLTRTPGGSSGGSAAAVASGEVWYALGTDTGGSVRQPASCCGLTGLKPTYGTVSRYGLVAYAAGFDQVGPLCRTAEDCAAVLDAIRGHDERDSTSCPGPYPSLLQGLDGDLRGLRVGLPEACFASPLSDRVRKCVLEAAEGLEARGAVVEYCALPELEQAVAAYYVLACAQASSDLGRYDGVRFGLGAQRGQKLEERMTDSRSRGFGQEVKRRILLGTYVLSRGYYDRYYKKAQLAQERLKGAFGRLFERYDLLLTPVMPDVAPALGTSLGDPARMYLSDIYTVCANLTGLPALSMPCGLVDGLPVGAQLMAPAMGESLLLNAAYAWQQDTQWHRCRPECFGVGGDRI